jgi:hypothetical protein
LVCKGCILSYSALQSLGVPWVIPWSTCDYYMTNFSASLKLYGPPTCQMISATMYEKPSVHLGSRTCCCYIG